MSCPAKTVVNVPGTRSCSRAKATAGRALRAAQPQIELTTTNVAPGASRSVASTSSAVRSSRTPSRVSSSRIGVTNRSSYGMIVSCREVMPRRLQIVVAAAVADQREDGCLRHDEITIAFERDLDACLTEEQRVVADARLHWHESRLASRRAPWLVAQLAGIRHRKAGASGRNAPALHRLTIHCRRRQIQPHLAAFFALFECDEHAIADHDEGLRAAGFWCHGSGARGSGAASRVRFQRYKGGHGRTGPDRAGQGRTVREHRKPTRARCKSRLSATERSGSVRPCPPYRSPRSFSMSVLRTSCTTNASTSANTTIVTPRRTSVVSDIGSQFAHSARACPMRSTRMSMSAALVSASATLSITAKSGARHTH